MALLRSLRKFGAIGAGVAASITGAVVAVKATSSPSCSEACCANSCRPKMQQSHFPEIDRPPFQKWNFNWDRMEPGQGGLIWPMPPTATNEKKLSTSKLSAYRDCNDNVTDDYPKARRNLILIRHGQYNAAGDDDCKHTLTELGREQAAFAGKKLASMGIKFTSITCSTLTRAIQTSNIILQNIDIGKQKDLKLETKDPLLSEGTPCIPEPPYHNPELWNPPERDVVVEGSRIEAGFRKYFHRADPSQEDDSWEIIVCHANVIRYFSCRALQFPPEGWLRISLDHCSITRFTILPTGEVILRGLGDSGYIPYEKATVANCNQLQSNEN